MQEADKHAMHSADCNVNNFSLEYLGILSAHSQIFLKLKKWNTEGHNPTEHLLRECDKEVQ